MIKSPLKWAGSKARIISHIQAALPKGKCLIEPFVGSGTVFLNTSYSRYVLGDLNDDIIHFFMLAQSNPEILIEATREIFEKCNDARSYYRLRDEFNNVLHPVSKAVLFLYLNRHCFNGLCRYSEKSGFNVPYGHYKNPYFPEAEIIVLSKKASSAIFLSNDFESTIDLAEAGDIVYCDPPYLPKPGTDSHTKYSAQDFTLDDHRRLVDAVRRAHSRGASIVISNRLTDEALSLYADFDIQEIDAHRSISCKSDGRAADREIIASMRAA